MKLFCVAFAGALAASALPAVAQAPVAPPVRVEDGRYVMKDGEQIYKNVCQACHMPDAMGAKGAGAGYPALAKNPKLAAASYPIQVIINGQKGMPMFGPYFDDQQIAAVVGYVRTHFGNAYAAPVTAADVKALRPAKQEVGTHSGMPG